MRLEEAFGETLRAARKRRGLSQEALALEAGVERNYVSLIELGRNSPSMRILFKLCRVLEVWHRLGIPDTFDRWDDDIGGVQCKGSDTERSSSVRR
jgi:transcriptional regulator with XRE-family HTH domain